MRSGPPPAPNGSINSTRSDTSKKLAKRKTPRRGSATVSAKSSAAHVLTAHSAHEDLRRHGCRDQEGQPAVASWVVLLLDDLGTSCRLLLSMQLDTPLVVPPPHQRAAAIA
jgi:hypothetical protein